MNEYIQCLEINSFRLRLVRPWTWMWGFWLNILSSSTFSIWSAKKICTLNSLYMRKFISAEILTALPLSDNQNLVSVAINKIFILTNQLTRFWAKENYKLSFLTTNCYIALGKGLIHSRHRKGGSSQRRFERGREKQMEYFFTRVCNHAREHLEPNLRQLDYVYYGGERHTLLSFRRQCDFLKQVEDRVYPSLLNVREPKQATLLSAVNQVWCSEVIEYKEEYQE